MLLLRLALLNISRNWRRSTITACAIAMGMAALIFLNAYRDGAIQQMQNNIVHLYSGSIQITRAGFRTKLSSELVVPDVERVAAAAQSNPDIVSQSRRTNSQALISTGDSTRGVLLIGIDPGQEQKVTALPAHITSGQFLSGANDKELIIGDRLAEKLHLKVGDRPAVLLQAVDGTTAGALCLVKGIYHTGSMQVDELVAYVPISLTQTALGLDGQCHAVVLQLKDKDSIPRCLASLRAKLPVGYEILPWYDILPEPMMWVKWYGFMLQTMFIMVISVIAIGIMNTIFMSVFERTKEFGVMLAIGTSPRRLTQLVLLETLMLELGGVLLGTLIGLLLSIYFEHVGITCQGLDRALAQSYLSSTIYTAIEPMHVLQEIMILLSITTVISFYPAYKAGKLEPVKAIYHS